MAVLNEEKKGIEKVLSSYRDIKSVLCTKDFDLENNARHLLAEIAEVDETFEDNKEEDFNFSYDDTFYLIEIKGSGRGLKRQHIQRHTIMSKLKWMRWRPKATPEKSKVF